MHRMRTTLALAGLLALGAGALAGQTGDWAARVELERRLEQVARAQARALPGTARHRATAELQVQQLQQVQQELQARRVLQVGQMSQAMQRAQLRQVERMSQTVQRVQLRRVERMLARRGAQVERFGLASWGRYGASARSSFRERAPEPWLVQDPADSLYRAARESLNARRFEEAASRFAELRERFPRSGYVGDAYYFQALALFRAGGPDRMDRARELLTVQARTHPDASTAEDARGLLVRIQGERARRGDAEAAAQVARSASADCDEAEESVRATALSALLQMDSERAAPILREVLQQRDECSVELRKQAVFLIAQKMSDENVDILLDLAQRDPDPDPEVREAAIFWLSQVRSEEALDALLSILEAGDVDEETREQVVFAVAQHRSPRSAAVLRDIARDATAATDLRANAIFWLGQQNAGEAADFLRQLYGSLEDPELKERVLFSVAQRRSPETRAWLLARASDEVEAIEVRKNALFWAGQAGLSAGEAIEIYRATTDPEMKEQALFVISQVQGNREEAADALMEIARTEEDPELKEQAIFWLGQNKDPRVVDFLLELLRRGG